MNISVKVQDSIARVIGNNFTTNEIVNIFTNANIRTDKSLSEKWKITFDAFKNIATEDAFFHILGEFCHPLCFKKKEIHQSFIESLNQILFYEDIQIQPGEKTVKIVSINGGPQKDFVKSTQNLKTSTDYILEAINFFKDEYNKVKITGLKYEYSIGENPSSDQTDQDGDDYGARLRAIERLKDAGFIIKYEIEERVENGGYYVWDYAICEINEKQITQKEAPPATEAGAQALTQKIIHEHTHRFENSIQEKGIEIKYAKEAETKMNKMTLKDKKIHFDDDTAKIFIGDTPIPLPAYKNEHYFCRSIFNRKKGEVTDWSTIYQEMTGKKEPKDPTTNKRTVRDTMYAVNNRICEVLNTDDKMFVWSEKTVTRQY